MNVMCGMPSLCYCFIGFIACSGTNLQLFPKFNVTQRNSTVQIDLSVNQLRILPDFNKDSWPKLKLIDLRINPSLPCKVIHTFESRHPDLEVYHQCDQKDSDFICSQITTAATSNTIHNDSETAQAPTMSPGFHDWTSSAILIICEAIIMALIYSAYGIYKIIKIAKIRLQQGIQSNVQQGRDGISEGERLERLEMVI